jgi:hypothetical protein
MMVPVAMLLDVLCFWGVMAATDASSDAGRRLRGAMVNSSLLLATTDYCNPTLTDPPQLCPGGVACPNCGSNSCACPAAGRPTPHGNNALMQATTDYCNPTLTDPPQLCPGEVACPNCGSNSCACPTPPDSECSDNWETNNNGGVNIPPGDNPVQGVTTTDGCKQACSGNGECVGWTWTYGKCYIKSSVGCMTYDPKATSGYCRPWSGPQCGYGKNALMQAVAARNDSAGPLGGELGSQTCSTRGNACTPSIDGKPPISCCGELECQQIIGGKVCEWPATCAAPGQTCHDSVNGKPPLTCCGDSVCTQIPGGKVCQYPDTCAAPGETCYDSLDGKPPLTCCDGHECQQIPGGKVCASDRGQ